MRANLFVFSTEKRIELALDATAGWDLRALRTIA